MKNDEIISEIAASVYGEAAVQDMIRQGKEIPMHSLIGWKKRGYRVKAGEHGIETRLWKKRKNAPENEKDSFYLTKTFLFTENQVEEDRYDG